MYDWVRQELGRHDVILADRILLDHILGSVHALREGQLRGFGGGFVASVIHFQEEHSNRAAVEKAGRHVPALLGGRGSRLGGGRGETRFFGGRRVDQLAGGHGSGGGLGGGELGELGGTGGGLGGLLLQLLDLRCVGPSPSIVGASAVLRVAMRPTVYYLVPLSSSTRRAGTDLGGP